MVKFWNEKPQLTISRKTLIEVDPDVRDVKWFREFAMRTYGRPAYTQEFPKDGFDEIYNNNLFIYFANLVRLSFRLGVPTPSPNKNIIYSGGDR